MRDLSEIFAIPWSQTEDHLVANPTSDARDQKWATDPSRPITRKDRLISILLIQLLKNSNDAYNHVEIQNIQERLLHWSEQNLEALVTFYDRSKHIPNKTQLTQLLRDTPRTQNANVLIQRFKQRHVDNMLRDYSFNLYQLDSAPTPDSDFHRVLNGLKRKKNGPQEGQLLSTEEKRNLIGDFNRIQQIGQTLRQHNDDALKQYLHEKRRNLPDALPEVLACMRQIMLRTNGKILNDTQLLALVYAARHSDESMILQLQTGEGKSLVTLMRTAYLALTGHVVDAFSSKESLPERDYPEAISVLDNMGIRHALIHANSEAQDYHDKLDEHGIGAVNYSTAGQFALFMSNQTWQNTQPPINLDPSIRVAYIDEIDYVLHDDETQFNYAASIGNNGPHNPDAWVYEVIWEYYKNPQRTPFYTNQEGKIQIQANVHLKQLCSLLQEKAKQNPNAAAFYEKYLRPDLSEDSKYQAKRDEHFMVLLRAAHKVNSMQEGVNYSVAGQTKRIPRPEDGAEYEIPVRVAEVMIDNQIIKGATYSDMVQQLLHTKLNSEAKEHNQPTNFFIDPITKVGFSFNIAYMMQHWYSKREGCTGTAGNGDEVSAYAEYGITQVLKMPTNKETSSIYHPPVYCGENPEENASEEAWQHAIEQGEKAQVQELVNEIVGAVNAGRPVLITCDDDIAVKRLSKKIATQLAEQHPQIWQRLQRDGLFIEDTNDKGISENSIVPLASRAGAITISSRMGRGTDIKPVSELGLLVLNTNITKPRTRKQRDGRQGRNGHPGEVKEIINFTQICYEFHRIRQNEALSSRLDAIIEREREHLRAKLEKHAARPEGRTKRSKAIWQEIRTNDALKHQYLLARSIQTLNTQLNQEQKQDERKKERLIANYSDIIFHALRNVRDVEVQYRLKEAWVDCLSNMSDAWHSRLQEQSTTHESYEFFERKAQESWGELIESTRGFMPFPLTSAAQQPTTRPAQQPAAPKAQPPAADPTVQQRLVAKPPAPKPPTEQRRAEQRRAEQRLAEQQRAEQQRAEQQRAEQQRAEQQRAEQRLAEQQRAEQQRAEQQRAEQQRAEQRRAEQQRAEQRRAEQQRAEQQRAEQQRAEQQRAEQQRAEQRRAEQQRAEQQRAEQPPAAQQPARDLNQKSINDAVQKMIEVLISIQHEQPSGPISTLTASLKRRTENFRDEPKDIKAYTRYKRDCTNYIKNAYYKEALEAERHDKHHILGVISEAFRSLFNLIDVFIASIVGGPTMAATSTPGARWMFNRDHFFTPPPPTSIGEKIIDFETKLTELENVMRGSLGNQNVPNQ
jgi:hypothetical protein